MWFRAHNRKIIDIYSIYMDLIATDYNSLSPGRIYYAPNRY